MLYQEYRYALLITNSFDQVIEFPCLNRIHPCGGFVQEEKKRIRGHRPCYLEASLRPVGKILRKLIDKGIKTNCTLCFSPGQALLAAKAGATYISPFVGRLDDISSDGIDLVYKISNMYSYYGYETQSIAASVRHTMHIMQCTEAGADVVTCPLDAILGLLKHPLTDSGLAKFLADHNK